MVNFLRQILALIRQAQAVGRDAPGHGGHYFLASGFHFVENQSLYNADRMNFDCGR